MHDYMPPGAQSYKLYMNAYERDGQLYFRDNNKFKVPVNEVKYLLNPDLITRTTKEADKNYGIDVFPT